MKRSPHSPLTIVEERDLAAWLIDYFDPLATHARLAAISPNPVMAILPSSAHDAMQALPDSFSFIKSTLYAGGTYQRMLQRLCDAGLLTYTGSYGSAPPPLNQQYFAMPSVSGPQARGETWLTPVLGWEHLMRVVTPALCRVLGQNDAGDQRNGSGVFLASGHIITNKHVVEDMTPRSVIVGSHHLEIDDLRAHPLLDVAVVYPKGELPPADVGLVFREHRSVEPLLILGYPPVPFARTVPLVAQTGETCGATVEALDGQTQLLLSAISRPGNSGGPVFAGDGRIIGLVSRSLVRQVEAGEEMAQMPFYAAVPAVDVRDAVRTLDPTIPFPWETWGHTEACAGA